MKELFKFNWDFSWSTASASIKTSIIILVILAIFFISMGIAFSRLNPKKDKIPTKGLMFVTVLLVNIINKFVENNMGRDNRKTFSPFFIGVSSFLALANISSCFGLNPVMANIGVALSYSVLSFFILQFTGLKYQGLKERVKGFMGPVKAASPLVFPISLIGEITTPFSMGMRLFGNLFSGVILAGIIFGATNMLGSLIGGVLGSVISNTTATIFVTVLLHPIFDLFFGLLQMYVFFMLTTMFIKQNM